MTDSDSDASNSVFTFQNVNTTVSAKGPNTNITNLSFRNQLTSTMCMPRNFERQRYAESVCDQRSMYYRRETSPMSIHSACDIRPRNYQQYYGGMSSQQSVFNGRSGSPMSVRSIDSTASVSAADIAFAFKNVKFNKYDLKVIKDAYHRLMKQRVRKRIEKRRNMRLFLKGNRRRSGYDSGEQGSNSSISSDDCRSVKTSYKENLSTTRSTGILTDFRKTGRDNMLKDCSTNLRQNTFKNMFSVGSSSNTNTQNFINSVSKQTNPMPTQKERFKNGFLLPSQRFNQSVASSVIPESSEKPQRSTEDNVKNHYAQNKQKNKNFTSGSDDEQIFSETVRECSTYNIEAQGKRTLDSEDESSLPEKKKSKLSSPTKNAQRNKRALAKPKNIKPTNTSNFEFAVPSLPVRKSKPKVQEQLIAKSAQPLTDFLEPASNKVQDTTAISQTCNVEEKSSNIQNQLELSETTQTSDVSMRPSFIKRKLFTQKLDVAEKANLSDGTSSPHSNVYTLQKEKNKTRKLVTSLSCLNRDVQDDNNLLDLIHKIVPAEHMNITNQSTVNQTKIDISKKNKKDSEDKWDVTSVISMCNEDDVSDTYTDEEIFEQDATKITKNDKNKEQEKNFNTNSKSSEPKVPYNNQLPRDCKIVLEKLENNNTIQKIVNDNNFNLTHYNVTKNNIKSSVKSFWDTDFESDAECHTAASRVKDNQKKANPTLEATKQDLKKSSGYEKNQVSKKSLPIPEGSKQLNNTIINNTVMNNTLDSTRKFNASTLSIRTHRVTTKKKCCNETCVDDTTINPDNKKKVAHTKSDKSSEPNKISVEKNNAKNAQSKKIPAKSKSKPNSQNETKERSTSNTRKKNLNETQPKPDKQIESPKNKDKLNSKKKLKDKANESVNKTLKSKAEKQKKLSAAKNKEDIQTIKCNPKSQTYKQTNNKKETKIKTPTNKTRTKKDNKNNSMISNKIAVSKTKSKLNNTMEPLKQNNISTRPIRSCRASSQNRSQEISSLSLNTSDIHKSLRSRIINLSSSIENITIKIKPAVKKVNQSISQMKTRKSDVSFSLANKLTPTPKKNLPRNKADFFKGKRKA